MNRNETIRNLAMLTTERQSSALAPEKDSSEKSSVTVLLNGRSEKRVPMAMPVDLVIAEEMLIAERVVTINVSPHGARVMTKRRWRAEEQLWLGSVTSYFRLQGSVVYCQPLMNGNFSVGLRFRATFIDWEESAWR